MVKIAPTNKRVFKEAKAMRKAYKRLKETKMSTLIKGNTPKVKDSGYFMHFNGVSGQDYDKNYSMMSYIIMSRY